MYTVPTRELALLEEKRRYKVKGGAGPFRRCPSDPYRYECMYVPTNTYALATISIVFRNLNTYFSSKMTPGEPANAHHSGSRCDEEKETLPM